MANTMALASAYQYAPTLRTPTNMLLQSSMAAHAPILLPPTLRLCAMHGTPAFLILHWVPLAHAPRGGNQQLFTTLKRGAAKEKGRTLMGSLS